MKRRLAAVWTIGLAAILAVASVATPQDENRVFHIPRRNFDIPVNLSRINQAETKPTHLQLYSSHNRSKWQPGAKLPLSGLQDVGEGKKGFNFTADRDGEYEFAIRYWYAGGESSPMKIDEMSPMLTIVVDTTPPVVRAWGTGNGVRWEATDDNIDSNTVKLEAKLANSSNWQAINNRGLKSSDTYAWQLTGQQLDVRVSVKDKAGNEGYSPIVRLPSNDAIGTSFPKGAGTGSDWPPTGPRDPIVAPINNLPKPRIEYVNGSDITVDYTIQKAGRSGVQAAHLYVQKDSSEWKFDKRFAIDPPADTGKTLSLKYSAEKEGLYGFYVAPESGAGVKANPPRRDDPPMLYVVVDKTEPYVKITNVRVIPGGVRGPMVEIAWETTDQNLMADPITIEYALDKDAIKWSEVKYRLPPGMERPDSVGQKRFVGSYTWEVPDESLWKFRLRIRSVDKAGNTGKDQWKEEVIVDLEAPAAGITGVRGGTGGPSTATPSPSTPSSPMGPSGSGPKLPDLPMP